LPRSVCRTFGEKGEAVVNQISGAHRKDQQKEGGAGPRKKHEGVDGYDAEDAAHSLPRLYPIPTEYWTGKSVANPVN
jgi:hypothetical protein